MGNGNGTFKARKTLADGSYPNQVSTGDFNGDGKVDLVTADDFGQSLSVFIGNGDGTFKTRKSLSLSLWGGVAQVGDINGDGKDDIVAISGDAWAFLGNGDGTFQSRYQIGESGTSYTDLKLADFNRDGKLDIAVTDNGTTQLSVLFGNGDGRW